MGQMFMHLLLWILIIKYQYYPKYYAVFELQWLHNSESVFCFELKSNY